MKRTERHHLKENQLAATLAETIERFEQNRRTWTWAGIGALVLIVAIGGFVWWRQQVTAKSSTLLAEALVVAEAPVTPPAPPAQPAGTPPPPATPPTPGSYPTEKAKLEAALVKFMAAADAYPSSSAGILARYHAATTLVALGRDAGAAQRFQEVAEKDGSGLCGRMARLGLAQVQVRQGKFDTAIATFQEVAATGKDDLPVDGILMALGQAYVAAGKKTEAGQTFKRIGDEFPTSPYAADAKKELDALKPGA